MDSNDLFQTIGTESDHPFSGSGTSSDDWDAFLTELDLDFNAGLQPDTRRKSSAAPGTPDVDFPSEDEALRRAHDFIPQDFYNEEPDPPEADVPHGFGGFIIRHHRVINLVLFLICLGLAAGIAWVVFFQNNSVSPDGKIMDNVYIAGTNVGGMTRDEAVAAVNAAIGSNFSDGTMVVELGGSQLLLSSSQTHPALNVQAAVNAAFSHGRSDSPFQRDNRQNTSLEISTRQYLTVDTDYIRSTVSNYLGGIAGEYSPSGFSLEGDCPALDAEGFDKSIPCQTLVLEVGNPGSQYNLTGICNAICDGYSQNRFHVVIPSEYLPQLPEKLDIDAIYQQLHVDAVEAVGDGDSAIPGSCGYTFDLEAARSQLSTSNYGQVISIPMEYVIPSKLDNNGSFTETLGTYSTAVSSNDAYNQNMTLLCQKLDGLILKPGEHFSFNTFFKNRTEKDGYQRAPRHGDCCAEVEVCGGADQVATTLYVAAKLADITVAEKYPGDHLCTYTTKGTEISVGAGWRDLKLTNSQKFPVKIRARVTGSQVIIQILSEQALDYYVKLETKEGYTFSHSTSYAARDAADGFTNGQVLIEGVDGCQVTLNWVKYDRATDTEISQVSEYVESHPMNTVLANVTR